MRIPEEAGPHPAAPVAGWREGSAHRPDQSSKATGPHCPLEGVWTPPFWGCPGPCGWADVSHDCPPCAVTPAQEPWDPGAARARPPLRPTLQVLLVPGLRMFAAEAVPPAARTSPSAPSRLRPGDELKGCSCPVVSPGPAGPGAGGRSPVLPQTPPPSLSHTHTCPRTHILTRTPEAHSLHTCAFSPDTPRPHPPALLPGLHARTPLTHTHTHAHALLCLLPQARVLTSPQPP